MTCNKHLSLLYFWVVLFSWLLQNGPQDFDSTAMGADYSFYVKFIATYAPTFLRYNNSVLAIVQWSLYCIIGTYKIVFCSSFSFSLPNLRTVLAWWMADINWFHCGTSKASRKPASSRGHYGRNWKISSKIWTCLFLLGAIHKLRWQDFGFFWPPTPLRDIFYFMNVDKKSTFLNYLRPPPLIKVVCGRNVYHFLIFVDFGCKSQIYPHPSKCMK